ncbi:MAG: AbiJ-NTD4 domain-containing protein, partial [bacterium]
LDEPNLSFEDAKFMLVSCSAFINYLITKAAKAGIKI